MMDNVCYINFNARVYDPALGRFMSPDIYVSDAFDGQSFNRYSYVNNRPLSLLDPSGNDPGIDTIVVYAAQTGNPVIIAAAVAVDIIADIFGFDLFGGSSSPPVPHVVSVSQPQPAQSASAGGNSTGIPQVQSTAVPAHDIDSVVVTGVRVNADATLTQTAAYAGVGATSAKQILKNSCDAKPNDPTAKGNSIEDVTVTAQRLPQFTIPSFQSLVSSYLSGLLDRLPNIVISPAEAATSDTNGTGNQKYCQMADGSIHPYQDVGGGQILVGSGDTNTAGTAVGNAVNNSAMPTVTKSGGISGGGLSGRVTSPASGAARGLTGNARIGAIRELTGTSSIGGSIGRALPVLGTALMALDFAEATSSAEPVCTPIG
jgi:RHS repeat-associated protein